jgi:hypothetical protein
MRRVTAILSVAVVVPMAAGLAAQAKPSFAGESKIVADPGQWRWSRRARERPDHHAERRRDDC